MRVIQLTREAAAENGTRSSADRPTSDPVPSRQRSRITNGSALLPGIDGRSAWVRRAKDIIADHTADLGGVDNCSAAERSIVRRAAVMTVELERLEAKFATAGEADADELDQYARVAANLRRLLEAVGLKRVARDVTPDSYARLSVWGSDSASSTLAFNVVNSASTTVFSVFDGGNAELSGSLSQSSDQRLKTNIQSLEASSSLSLIDELNPVTFNWIDPNQTTALQLGFIAQQVQQIFPNLVSTTSATALTPGGTLSLNYIGLISPIVSAIQDLFADIASIENAIAGFAQSFVSNTITANNELCVGSTCVTPAQFQAMVAAANVSQSSGEGSGGASSNDAEATDTPPVIQINGDNPAIVQVGDTYNDLGATITGPQADLNLGIQTFVNVAPSVVVASAVVAAELEASASRGSA